MVTERNTGRLSHDRSREMFQTGVNAKPAGISREQKDWMAYTVNPHGITQPGDSNTAHSPADISRLTLVDYEVDALTLLTIEPTTFAAHVREGEIIPNGDVDELIEHQAHQILEITRRN